MIYGIWHGGANYAGAGDLDYLETFDGTDDALAAAEDRYSMGHRWPQEFKYANGRDDRTLTPGVDESSTIAVYLADPREPGHFPGDNNNGPDYIIRFDEINEEFRLTGPADDN